MFSIGVGWSKELYTATKIYTEKQVNTQHISLVVQVVDFPLAFALGESLPP